MFWHRVTMLVPTIVQASGLAIMVGGALLLFGTAGAEMDIFAVFANIGAPVGFDPFGVGPNPNGYITLSLGC